MEKKEYTDGNYDYTPFIEPITLELVKETIMKEIGNYEVANPDLKSDVDMLAKRMMYECFTNMISYMSENKEADLESIAMGVFK